MGENEFPTLEDTDYQVESKMEISGTTEIHVFEKDTESTEIYDISIKDDNDEQISFDTVETPQQFEITPPVDTEIIVKSADLISPEINLSTEINILKEPIHKSDSSSSSSSSSSSLESEDEGILPTEDGEKEKKVKKVKIKKQKMPKEKKEKIPKEKKQKKLKEKKEKKKKVKSIKVPGELEVDIEQPSHEEYIVKVDMEVVNQSVDTTTSDVDIKLEETVHVITGELTTDMGTPTIEVNTNMNDSEIPGESATASLPVLETRVEEKLPEEPSLKHDQSSSSSSSESEDENVMPTEGGEKKKKAKKIKVKKEKKPKEKKEKKPKEKKDKKKKDKSIKLAGEMSIDIEPETSADIAVT